MAKKLKAPPKKRRARKEDGQWRSDDPSTPDVNEAFEPADPVVDKSRREAQRSIGLRTLGGRVIE